ncbi:MAG: hypothetical protein ACRCSG_02950 [Cellulosilyticaceae bacterium]
MSDCNYNREFEWIKEYRFPIKRGEETVLENFTRWQKEFIKNIDSMSILKSEDKVEIKNFGETIQQILQFLEVRDISHAYNIFFERLNAIKQYLPYSILGRESRRVLEYYRINWEAGFEYGYKTMLHVPFSLRHMSTSGRYSMAGMPCTYMATSKMMAWYESKMPNKFYIQKFSVYEDNYNYRLLRLDLNPLKMHREINHIKNEHEKYECIKSYCLITPLLVGCSYSVKNIGVKFCEEYQISQMLMTWLKHDKDFIGIRYNSSVGYDVVRNYGDHNVAIPIREVDASGYCKFLQGIFNINQMNENAKVEKLDISQYIEEHKNEVEAIRGYYNKVKYEVQHNEHPECYWQFLDICKVFIENWDSIMNYNIQEQYSSIVTIQKLWRWAESVKNIGEEDMLKSVSGEVLADDKKEVVQGIVEEFNEEVLNRLKRFMNFPYIV